MENTPIAWMRRLNGRIIRITPEKVWDDDEPLYIAPRELNDEEIGEIFSKYGEKDKWFDFAKAILKKASGK